MPSATSAQERRAYPRRESGCIVYARPQRDRTANAQQQEWMMHSCRLKGSLVDVSMNGVAFLLSEPIEQNERVLLRLANHRLHTSIDVAASVLRTIYLGDDEWKIVCSFERNLTYEQVHLLGQHLFQSRFV